MKILLGAIVLAISACAQIGEGGAWPDISGPWLVESIAGETLPADAGVTIAFAADGSVSGNGGCNNYRGRYAYRKGVVTISEVGSTMMACVEAGRMEREATFHARLGAPFTIASAGAHALTLSNDSGRIGLRRATN